MKVAGYIVTPDWRLRVDPPRFAPTADPAPSPEATVATPPAPSRPAPAVERVWHECRATYQIAPFGGAHYTYMGQSGPNRIIDVRTYPPGLLVACADLSGTFAYTRRFTRPVKGEEVFPRTLRPGKRTVAREITLVATWEE